MTMLLFIKQK